jgi:outer membrane protein OmpA-like peptidoglycan-associated protein
LRDGTLITLAHGVRLELDSLRVPQGVQREGFALNLLQGSLRVISGVIAQINPSLFQVKTPSATMGVRGTDFVTQTPARWWPWPSTRVTLFPEEDGRPSALVVQGPGGSQTLDQPYQRATSSLNGPNQASQTSARAVFWFMPDMGSFKVPPATKVNLYFEAGGVQLTPDSQTAFSQLVKSFKGRSDMDIMVIGHSDRAGDDESNEALSLQRAQAIGQTLTEQGFSAEQVQAFGMGERRPLKPTEDGVAEALNRRVELVVR